MLVISYVVTVAGLGTLAWTLVGLAWTSDLPRKPKHSKAAAPPKVVEVGIVEVRIFTFGREAPYCRKFEGRVLGETFINRARAEAIAWLQNEEPFVEVEPGRFIQRCNVERVEIDAEQHHVVLCHK
jgi:hypothetical protein